ncbi:MAG: PAS domain-containing protein [Armatimonadetes bacterium]|nr:PAS domain-containing protein [Armatimonadota bacterium]
MAERAEGTDALTQPWLAELLAASAEGIALYDPQGRISRANALLAELVGLGDDELLGLGIDDLFHDPSYSLAVAAARQRGRWHGILSVGEREVEAHLVMARDGHGVVLCHDISERLELGRRAESLAALAAEHASRAEDAQARASEQS